MTYHFDRENLLTFRPQTEDEAAKLMCFLRKWRDGCAMVTIKADMKSNVFNKIELSSVPWQNVQLPNDLLKRL